MSMHLSQAEIASFRERGFLTPRRVLSAFEAMQCRLALEAFESIPANGSRQIPATDLHLLFRWAWNVVHDARIVNPVTDLLGPNVLLWGLNWFIKEARDGKFVTWHQDATYWGLEPHDVVTAWVALSDAGPATGPMKFIPGSHKGPILRHRDSVVRTSRAIMG